MPSFVVRCLWVLGLSAVIAAIGLGGVDLVTRPTTPGATSADAREEHRPLAPDPVGGAGDLAVQALLVAGIAIVGRKVLRIRL